MLALEFIGWAFFAGCCVVAFIAPIYLFDAIFSRKDSENKEDPASNRGGSVSPRGSGEGGMSPGSK